jgi:acetyltransferase-like isoleucine patch superfamily enzyme
MFNNTITMVCLDGGEKQVDGIPGCRVNFKGSNNKVVFFEGSRFSNSVIVASENNVIRLGKKSVFRGLVIYALESVVKIGNGFSCWGLEIRAEERGTRVEIGNNCMFSKGINMYPTDCHTIFDVATKECINKGGTIKVGDHVWCGINVLFLKNTEIKSDSIIAAGSLVTKSFDNENILIAGSPAKVVRTGVNWDRRAPSEYK